MNLFSLFIGLMLAGAMIAACDDNELDPIDRDTGIYGIYGALNLDDELNYIRVKDLKAEFTQAATDTIDATVTLENLESGAVQTLGSETLKWEDIYLHNFIVNGPIAPDTRYRVTATSLDGAEVAIETMTPTMPAPHILPINDDCYTPITITFDPSNGGTIVLRLGIQISFLFWRTEQVLQADPNTPEKITYTFTPREELRFIPGGFGDTRCYELRDDTFYIAYTHYGPGFYEKIENDPFDILASTDRLGALYQDTLTFPIDTSRVCPQDCQPDE